MKSFQLLLEGWNINLMALLFVFSMFSSPHVLHCLSQKPCLERQGRRRPRASLPLGPNLVTSSPVPRKILVCLSTPCLTPSPVLYWLTWVYGILLMTMSAVKGSRGDICSSDWYLLVKRGHSTPRCREGGRAWPGTGHVDNSGCQVVGYVDPRGRL